MASGFIQFATGVADDADDGSFAISFPSPTTPGSSLFFWAQWEGSVADVTLNLAGDGSNLDKRTQRHYGGAAPDLSAQLFYRSGTRGGDTTFTFTYTASTRPFKKAVGAEFSVAGTMAFDDDAAAEAFSDGAVISSGAFDSLGSQSILLGTHAGYSSADTLSATRINDVASAGVTNNGSCYMWYRLDAAFSGGDADAQQSVDGDPFQCLINGYSFSVTPAAGGGSGNRKLVKTFVSLAGLVAPFLMDKSSGLYLRDSTLVAA